MINFPGLLSSLPQLQANVAGLIRRLQTTVEHIRITNVEPTANIEKGEVFCLTAGKRNALLAVGSIGSALLAEWVGVAGETIGSNSSGIGVTNGKAYCLFEPGLDPAPAANDRVYLSASIPGRMTNVAPSLFNTYISSIGYITESNYAEDGSCMVQLQRCCFPPAPPISFDFETTKQAQSWQLNLTAGDTYSFDWGDGTGIDSYVGDGSLQTVTHNYAVPGTYQIGCRIDNPLALTDFRCSLNILSGLSGGPLPSFASCTNLINFYCEDNAFSGTLPSFAACTNLVRFYCNENSFSGTLPSFASCTNLINFYCEENSFSGTLPSFASCINLTQFWIYYNNFSGPLPSFASCTLLYNFFCFSNEFSGTLPSFAACTNLYQFYCDSNAFSGTLPSFAACTNLVAFACSTNEFSGTLPSFAECINLRFIACFSNEFSGTLPSFAACTNMLYFLSWENQFSGTLPSFSACATLIDFYCYTNQFSDYEPGVMPTPCRRWEGGTNQFPQTAIDAILADFETNIAARPATGVIGVGGVGNAVLGVNGIASRDAIWAAKGALNWPITHN